MTCSYFLFKNKKNTPGKQPKVVYLKKKLKIGVFTKLNHYFFTIY